MKEGVAVRFGEVVGDPIGEEPWRGLVGVDASEVWGRVYCRLEHATGSGLVAVLTKGGRIVTHDEERPWPSTGSPVVVASCSDCEEVRSYRLEVALLKQAFGTGKSVIGVSQVVRKMPTVGPQGPPLPRITYRPDTSS